MAYTKNPENLLLGTGKLVCGTTDVGYFQEASLSLTREELQHLSGWPKRADATIITAQNAEFTVTLQEFTWSNLELAFGVSSADGKVTFGNLSSLAATSLELWIPKKTPSAGSLVLHIYKAQIAAGLDISFSDDDWQGLPLTFQALADPSNNYAIGYILLTTTTCVA